jgi:prepilin-type N-terminal cleavage/methylation domain-containing protein
VSRGRGAAGPRGSTLIELVVVLAILGLLLGVSALGLWSLRHTPEDERLARIASARREALQRGSVVTIGADDSGRVLRFLPDGRAIGNEVDPLTGSVVAHAR